MRKANFIIPLLVSAGVLWAAPRASATILYATEAAGPANAQGIAPFNIVRLDTVAHTDTIVLSQSTNIDSLFFDPAGRIIFSEQFANKVLAFDLNTSTTTTLAVQAQGLLTPADMALDPSGTSFLVSNIGNNTISRISLAGGVIGTLHVVDGSPNGLIYDNTGRLFVNVAFPTGQHRVERIDPATGSVIGAPSPDITGLFLDGLTFDAGTGMLFASARQNSPPTFSGAASRILQIDPSNLSNFTLINTPVNGPDGIVSDGFGHLFIADGANVLQYDISSHNEIVVATSQLGFDDIAPAAGLGAPTDAAAVPEPSLTYSPRSGVASEPLRWRGKARASAASVSPLDFGVCVGAGVLGKGFTGAIATPAFTARPASGLRRDSGSKWRPGTQRQRPGGRGKPFR